MKRRTIARVIAVFLLAYLFAFWLSRHNNSEIAHYRTLSRDELIGELSTENATDFDTALFVGLFLLGAVSLCVDGVSAAVLIAIDRISPPPKPVVPASGEIDHSDPRYIP